MKIQILSDQAKNFQNISGLVNYQDPNYSVGLPVFSIHGNHDDPSRESGELLAALGTSPCREDCVRVVYHC